MAQHSIVHVEISAKDLGVAGRFYSDLFDWKIEHMGQMEYALFRAGDGPGGGLTKADGEMFKPGDVIVYVSTDDIEASLAKAEALGGKTLVPKSEVPGFGWYGIFADPTGNRIGLWTAVSPAG